LERVDVTLGANTSVKKEHRHAQFSSDLTGENTADSNFKLARNAS